MTLRVIDFGTVSALRSQTLWHAIARGVSDGAPPTLSFMQPDSPYVSIGYHRRFSEVDAEVCAARDLAVFRRMVGGGPVYLDQGQRFFQVTIPLDMAAGSHRATMRRLLAPAVEAYRAAGIAAEMDAEGELVVGDRKVCGHAGGQVGDAVIVVGNLITSFDHAAAASTLRVPDERIRPELVRLMSRYVAPTPCDPKVFGERAVDAYAGALGLSAVPGVLGDIEMDALERLDEQFQDPSWVRGDDGALTSPWRVKIKSGVRMFSAGEGSDRLTLSIGNQRVLRAMVWGDSLNGSAPELASRLEGLDVGDVATAIARLGPDADAFVALARGVERT